MAVIRVSVMTLGPATYHILKKSVMQDLEDISPAQRLDKSFINKLIPIIHREFSPRMGKIFSRLLRI
ncbi:hypothetical protein CO251_12615 [Sulfobacillus sp. hq2]|nr:hypothetical protein CO251_12615 [Sulfobacillus sp. hq2]